MASPIDVKWIEKMELELNFFLPVEYKEAMAKENGGMVESNDEDWELFKITDQTNKKTIAKTWNNVKKETMTARQWKGFPSNAIAIGESSCGDKLILFPENNFIYQWSHETALIEKIADSFSCLERIY